MFALIWVVPEAIAIAVACCFIMGWLGLISDYDGMVESSAVIISAIAGGLSGCSWYVVESIAGSTGNCFWLWVLASVIILAICSFPIGLVTSWAESQG